jgi:hypothetical protein
MLLTRRMRLSVLFFAVLSALAWPWVSLDSAPAPILLPVEILGDGGTVVTRAVRLDSRQNQVAVSLWMRVHGLRYPEQASVQWNDSQWMPLNNSSVSVIGSAKAYGGIGGAFSTLELSIPLPTGVAVPGENIVRFRFNQSDGLSSGFRILAFNVLNAAGEKLVPPERFFLDSPDTWTAPHPDAPSIETGRQLWNSAALAENSLPNSRKIQAHCADCHARDGRDLKYFNFSNFSIVTRSRFHGLSELQGEQIASYIRTLPVSHPGRPWNPPYQPGPGLDAQPVSQWAAGAGLDWILKSDEDSLAFLINGHAAAVDSSLARAITPNLFRPDGNLNAREAPVSLPLPDWNQWLPRIHPKDAWGAAFTESKFAAFFDDSKLERSSPHSLCPALQNTPADLRAILPLFAQWSQARRSFLSRQVKANSPWTPEQTNKVYSAQLWQLVKTWELMQEFSLEERGQQLFGTSADSRTWWSSVASETAPVQTHIPNGPASVNGSALNNEYLNAAWYQLQTVLNSGTHRRRDRQPVDWVYNVSEFRQLYDLTREPEPARLLVSVIKALQSSDPRINPQDYSQGWRPDENIDPRVLVASDWSPMFRALPIDVRRSLTQSLLEAWLDKNTQYPLAQYLSLPRPPHSTRNLYGDDSISGGKAWLAIDQFRAAGVSEDLLQRLQAWGAAYTDRAARIQY